jgi:hypothetical protein
LSDGTVLSSIYHIDGSNEAGSVTRGGEKAVEKEGTAFYEMKQSSTLLIWLASQKPLAPAKGVEPSIPVDHDRAHAAAPHG